MIHNIKLIEKGEVIGINDVVDRNGQQLADFEITLGVDILKFDDDYVNYNGSLIVSDKEVEDAVIDYMRYEYPEVYVYMIDM
jgi:activator of HSP90 ATPase